MRAIAKRAAELAVDKMTNEFYSSVGPHRHPPAADHHRRGVRGVPGRQGLAEREVMAEIIAGFALRVALIALLVAVYAWHWIRSCNALVTQIAIE